MEFQLKTTMPLVAGACLQPEEQRLAANMRVMAEANMKKKIYSESLKTRRGTDYKC